MDRSKFWETILSIIQRNKETVIPIVGFTTLGGLFFAMNKRIFGEHISCPIFGEQAQASSPQAKTSKEVHRTSNKRHILEIPPETRKYIWEKLRYRDILRLRLVCDDFKTDVDTLVGVRGHLNYLEEEKFSFFRSVTLKKCFITDLLPSSDEKIFASPYHLEYLQISERSQLPLETLENILRDCNNVKMLFLRFNHMPDGANITSAISRVVLNSLRTKSNIRELQFVKIPSFAKTEKPFPRDISHISFPISKNLIYIDLEIPDVLPEQLPEWKYILEQQTKLTTLVVDLGGIYWKFFSTIISKSEDTLQGVCLYQLTHADLNSREESPFDWGIFRGCQNLQILQISGFRYTESMPSINFSMVPSDNLLELCIRRVVIGRGDVQRIYQEMPQLRSGSFEEMGVEGDTAAIELMMENRQAEIDREVQAWENTQRTIEIASDVMFYGCIVLVVSAYAAIVYRYYYHPEHPDEFFK